MDKIVNLDDFRDAPAEFVFSLTITTDGKVVTDLDTSQFETLEQINWGIALAMTGVAELIDLKREYMTSTPQRGR